jgi:hypothetical protein
MTANLPSTVNTVTNIVAGWERVDGMWDPYVAMVQYCSDNLIDIIEGDWELQCSKGTYTVL